MIDIKREEVGGKIRNRGKALREAFGCPFGESSPYQHGVWVYDITGYNFCYFQNS